MKTTMNLNKFNVIGLETEECTKIVGGNPYIAAFVAYIIVESAINPVSSYNSFMAGFKANYK